MLEVVDTSMSQARAWQGKAKVGREGLLQSERIYKVISIARSLDLASCLVIIQMKHFGWLIAAADHAALKEV